MPSFALHLANLAAERDINLFQNLLKDGADLGCKFHYETQSKPNGIAEAFLIGQEFMKLD